MINFLIGLGVGIIVGSLFGIVTMCIVRVCKEEQDNDKESMTY